MAGDPYQELGVARGASADDIQKAFRKLAKQYHPDRNPGDAAAEERFKRVSGAFELLRDPDKRRKFDRGEIDADGRETFRGGGLGGGAGRSGGANARFDGVDLEDIFDIFGGAGMGGQARSRGGFGGGASGGMGGGPAKGADIKATLDIELFDTILGNTRRVVFSDGRTVDVTIPKGAIDGQTLRLRGQGSMGRHGLAGDALITLKLRPHAVFSPDGADLHMDLAVSLPDAVLGGKVEAPTPDGPVSITVPKNTQSGAMLRLKGRGGIDSASGKRGDLFARLIVALPDNPDPRLESLAEAMRQDGGYVPKPLKPARR